MKYFYLLNNKNTGCYLRYLKDLEYRHYVLDSKDATKFTIFEAKKMLKKFKHPENWVIVRAKKIDSLRTSKQKKPKGVRKNGRKQKDKEVA